MRVSRNERRHRRGGLSAVCLAGSLALSLAAAALAAPDPLAANPPTLIALFLAFAKMSLSGFGGVLAFARRGIVEEHKWMTAEEFTHVPQLDTTSARIVSRCRSASEHEPLRATVSSTSTARSSTCMPLGTPVGTLTT